jgi:hypothetical protein
MIFDFFSWFFTEQWVVLFLLRKPWLLGYLCSILLCLNFRIFFSKGHQGMTQIGWFDILIISNVISLLSISLDLARKKKKWSGISYFINCSCL